MPSCKCLVWLVLSVCVLIVGMPVATTEGGDREVMVVNNPVESTRVERGLQRSTWSVDGRFFVAPKGMPTGSDLFCYGWWQEGWKQLWDFDAAMHVGPSNRSLTKRWTGRCTSVALSDKHVFAAYSSGVVWQLRLETGEVVGSFGTDKHFKYGRYVGNEGPYGRGLPGVWSVDVSVDDKWMVTGHQDHTVRLWDVAKRQQVRVYLGHKRLVWVVKISPQGDQIISAEQHKFFLSGGNTARGTTTVRAWCLSKSGHGPATVRTSYRIPGLGRTPYLTRCAFSPDGKLLALCNYDGRVVIVDARGLKNFTELRAEGLDRAHASQVNGVAFSRDGLWLLTGAGCKVKTNEKGYRVIDEETGQPIYEKIDNRMRLWRVNTSPGEDRKSLIVTSQEMARFRTPGVELRFFDVAFLLGDWLGSRNSKPQGLAGSVNRLYLWPDPRTTFANASRPVGAGGGE